uniref:Adaptin_N domain-containing protein n=1 Tax=Heterorhabditis bacteriophora TaxID=37862 RepID=A0A1I7XS82_HETBA
MKRDKKDEESSGNPYAHLDKTAILQEAIVDKNGAVSSAALVSSNHLMNKSAEVVRRWANEIQEAVSSDNQMVQYHALGLLYHIRCNDRLAVNKMVQKFSKSGLRSELASAISVLQLFCVTPRAALRFAAVRTLNKVSINDLSCNYKLWFSICTYCCTSRLHFCCNLEVFIYLFIFIIHMNYRSIATLAITTLLKTGLVCSGLAHLCEFIEDCEHDSLAIRVLHLLGREAPKTPNPSGYIRFIYNRVILESTKVRAAAVTALAKFGAQCFDLRPSVRDRATFYLHLLAQAEVPTINNFVMHELQVSSFVVSDLLGMCPCERSDRVPEGKTQHTFYLAGVFRGGRELSILYFIIVIFKNWNSFYLSALIIMAF